MKSVSTLIVLVSVLSSCNLTKSVVVDETPVVKDTVVVMVEPAPPKDSLVVSFERTPCFGRCPVFKIKVYESGFATYEGLNFAEKIGLYSYRFNQDDLQKIYQMAESIDYFNLDSDYNDPLISDLPSAISKITLNDKSHRIRATRGMPKSLNDFHENLGVMLNEKDWKPYSLR